MPSIEENFAHLGIVLPAPPKPVASYVPFVRTGNLVFISGQLPSRDSQVLFRGKVPVPIGVEQAQEAARLALINALAVLGDACGGRWDRLVRIVRLGVFVQCEPDFDRQSVVANGASDLLAALFGAAGRHARAAVGSNALPLGSAVEVELLAEIGDG